MAGKKSPRYSEEFKKTIVNLHQNGKSYPTPVCAIIKTDESEVSG